VQYGAMTAANAAGGRVSFSDQYGDEYPATGSFSVLRKVQRDNARVGKGSGYTDATVKPLVLHAFKGGYDEKNSYGDLILDGAGNLYGTAYQGGRWGYGVVFQLQPNSKGGWTEPPRQAEPRDREWCLRSCTNRMAGQVWGRATRPSLSNNGKILSSWLFRRKKIMKGTSPRACPFPFHRQSRAHTEIQLSALGTESHTVRSSDKLHSLAMDVKLGRLLELLSQLSQGKQRVPTRRN
jgi:uncharacterized repeat protein (TIGR03803 family)